MFWKKKVEPIPEPPVRSLENYNRVLADLNDQYSCIVSFISNSIERLEEIDKEIGLYIADIRWSD